MAWILGACSCHRSPGALAIRLKNCESSSSAGGVVMQVRIEYTYDPESKNWSYRVPSLGIVGGSATREDAEREVIEAITFALEDDPEAAEPSEGESRYLELSIQR